MRFNAYVICALAGIFFCTAHSLCLADSLRSGLAGGVSAGLGTTVYNYLAAPSVPDLFAKNFGYPTPQATVHAAGPFQPVGGDLNSWLSFERDIKKYYGNNESTRRLIASSRRKYQMLQSQENKRGVSILHAKGDAGEGVMDTLYRKDGWCKVASKSGVGGIAGRQGIDGLYTRRSPDGRLEVMISESKTGNSSLNRTQNGNQQMSMGWIRSNLKALLFQAEADLAAARQSGSIIQQQVAKDRFDEIMKIVEHYNNGGKMRYNMNQTTIEQVNGRPILRMQIFKVVPSETEAVINPRVTSKGTAQIFDIDLTQEKTWTKTQRAAVDGYFDSFEKSLAKGGNPQAAARVRSKLETDIKTGKINPNPGESMDHAVYRSAIKYVKGKFSPKVVKNALADGGMNPGVRGHALSYKKAGITGIVAGAVIAGVIAGGMELFQTGHLSLETAKAMVVGAGVAGTVAVATPLLERSAVLAQTRMLASSAGKTVIWKRIFSALTPDRLGGGVTVVVLAVGSAGYGYETGAYTGTQAIIVATEGVIVGGISFGIGCAVTAAVPIPGVNVIAGLLAGIGSSIIYHVAADGGYVGHLARVKALEMLKVDAELADARTQHRSAEERERIRIESERLLKQGWELLAATAIR
ncbi:MAG: hypothetical protein ACEB74_06010 [Desulfovibrio aminophilus]|uniref:hypothetical protein n=1 Tax=Desulfovibrio aminophilus TaxID=81425 RepID=UPI0039EBF2C9